MVGSLHLMKGGRSHVLAFASQAFCRVPREPGGGIGSCRTPCLVWIATRKFALLAHLVETTTR
jgi:hypothetical protein